MRSKKSINATRCAQGATHSHAEGDKARVDPIPFYVLQKVIDNGRRDDEPDILCIFPPLECNTDDLVFGEHGVQGYGRQVLRTMGREHHNL